MNRCATIAVACAVIATAGASRARQQDAPVRVEPSDLARRADLVGREVLVDDRVAYYVNRTGADDDELQLKRTPMTFLVPRRLRPPPYTRVVAAVVRGRLERQGSQLVCRVDSIELKPDDLHRLDGAVAHLGPRDYKTRRAWARWAEHRAGEFRDEPLKKRAQALEAEALRMEGEMSRLAVDAPEEWLRMAHEARSRKVAEPEPSALAHRALRARLASADSPAGLRSVAAEVDSFFPAAGSDRSAAKVNLKRWEAGYADDPAAAYREAPAAARKAMDRRLWADVRTRMIEGEPVADLPGAIALADRAAEQLPERPDLPARLIEKGIAAARRGLSTLRQDEVRRLSEVYRDRLRRPDDARQVFRDWLELKRKKVSESDAEGRVALASLYEDMIGDKVTAVELLRKAWRIDPTSRETAEAFRLRGYRRDGEGWVEANAPAATAGAARDRPTAVSSSSLIGLTPDELKRRLIAQPTFRNYVASRGKLIEQRVYLDTGSVRYVNLLRTPGESQARVIADYTLPRHDRKDVPHPVP